MTPEQWLEVQEVLRSALELPESVRTAYIAQACGGKLASSPSSPSPFADGAQFLESPAQLLAGIIVDHKYQIDRVLGKGGMGAVYLATHLGTTRTVAVKVINPEYAAIGEFIARFRREAVAAGRLRHPNIVNVTDFGVAVVAGKQLPYLVMEYLDGQTLGDYLKQHGRMPLDRVLDVVDQIALALDSAHAAGIVHRDLKPDNIWLESNRRGGYNVKVLDFGIAKIGSGEREAHRENGNSTALDLPANLQLDRTITIPGLSAGTEETVDLQTRLGAIVGTPAYMSPEQCLGISVDYRADIYSLAVITYELVSGQPPFQGATVAQLLTQQIEAPVPSPNQFDAGISKPIASAVMRGLEKDPAGRPVSAGTLAALLRAVVEGEFSVLRKGKDTFQSYASVFAPLWIASFAPVVPLSVAAVWLLSHVSKASVVPPGWLALGLYVAVLCTWLFCAQMFKAAAALIILKSSSIGAFRPATRDVIGRLINGLPDLLRTQIASLLDVRPASIWQNQLWPVVWALEGRSGKDALTRSRQLSSPVSDIALTLLSRFYAPPLCAVLLLPAVLALVPGVDIVEAVLAGGAALRLSIFYLFMVSRLYVLYGTAFPFFYWFAGSCRGESNTLTLPGSGAGRERGDSAKRRSRIFIWWLVPAALVCMILIGLIHKL
jgi:serine/threonine protein kinase